MDFYEQLKLKNNIVTVAFSLGYNGKKTGNCFQGDCPRHGSEGGKCLVIWPRIQGFRCYHCGEKGDVIDLVRLYKRCDHKTARDFLANQARMPHLHEKDLSPEEIERREAEVKEKMLVEDILTTATQWYHQQLQAYPDIQDHLLTHYGFSQEIIDELELGFGPPPRSDNPSSELAEHLSSFPNFKGKLALSGLFTFVSPSGPYYDYFRGRIIFPYWKGGKVVYMGARATSLTPIDQYECYLNKNGEIKKDEQGYPEFIKYKKLRTHDPDDEKKKFISRFIQNNAFLGEDTIYGEKDVLITEGFPDWVSSIDKGFAAISPATTNFRERDFEKLGRLTQNADVVYIINDNEENQAGLKGAINTARYLTHEGRNVFLVELPRPAGATKIDLNEYLVDHSALDLRHLMDESKSFLDILIDNLPGDFIKAQPIIKEEIAPLLIELDESKLEHYLGVVKKKTKTTQKALDTEIEDARERREEALKQSKQEQEKPIDPDVQKMADEIALDPLAFKHRLDLANELGVVGERGIMAIYYVALDSRLLLPSNAATPNALAIKNAGHPGAGKSFVLMIILILYPEDCYVLVTNGSAKSIYYLKEGLKHKAFIVTEGFQFQENNAVDSELAYITRSLISEGRIRYITVEKDEKGNLMTAEKFLEGPTSFITSTVLENLEVQLEDRLFTVHPDESFEQTKRIIQNIGKTKAGHSSSLDKKVIDAWKLFHKSLKPTNVIIPFAEEIARFITQREDIPIATRRAFNRVTSVIQAITCFYQNQRERDSEGRLISTIADYWMGLQIVDEAFRENMGDESRNSEERLQIVEDQGKILPKDLAKKQGVTVSAITGWAKKKVQDGILAWCDESQRIFASDADLKKAKHSGKAYLTIADGYTPVNVAGLPTPYDLTHDEKWNKGRELLMKYDLELKIKTRSDQVLSGVKVVLTPGLNTMQDNEPVKNISDSYETEGGVKVLTPFEEGDKNNFKESQEKGLGNDNGDGQGMKDLGNQTKAPADESSALMDSKTTLTPHLCRQGCKHYDPVGDPKTADFNEYCWKSKGSQIKHDCVCRNFETTNSGLPEGVLVF